MAYPLIGTVVGANHVIRRVEGIISPCFVVDTFSQIVT